MPGPTYRRPGSRSSASRPTVATGTRRSARKHDLPYPLLVDDGHAVAEAFGVWVEKTFAGRTYFGNERTTFVVGGDGRIERVLALVKPAEHTQQLIEALR